MFLDNYIETVGISAKLQTITYEQEKRYSVLKPAVKDKELTFLISRVAALKIKQLFQSYLN